MQVRVRVSSWICFAKQALLSVSSCTPGRARELLRLPASYALFKEAMS
jgi:hypothetical protein